MRPRQEQAIEAFCHLSNAIPIWGLFICGLVSYWLREESRSAVRQARQAMVFHSLILAALLVWCLVYQVVRLMYYLIPRSFCDVLSGVNNGMMLGFLALFVAICVWGAACRIQGQPFQYPFPRRRK